MASGIRLVNFNGELIPETEAKVSIYDSALMFGDMVFEMTQTQMIDECYRTVDANYHLFEKDD